MVQEVKEEWDTGELEEAGEIRQQQVPKDNRRGGSWENDEKEIKIKTRRCGMSKEPVVS